MPISLHLAAGRKCRTMFDWINDSTDDGLIEASVSCPYCGETIEVLVDPQDTRYIEDCQVCCRPINFVVDTDSRGNVMIGAYDENDTV